MALEIHGHVASGFEGLRDAFAANFEREDGFRELGAAYAVYRGEELIADLHAGYSDNERTTPWTKDNLVNIWSATKGVVGLSIAVLVERGLLEYGAPVARYWPEYAQNGKAETTVSQILSHQAGLPGFADPTSIEDFYNWERVTSRLARQAPMWPPGSKSSYHGHTVGFLAGELIRRVSGLSPGQFLAQELADPLRADVFLGLPEREEWRVASLVPAANQPPMDVSLLPPEVRLVATNPDVPASSANDRAWRAAELPAANAQASALGLARLYAVAANGGAFEGVRLLSPKTILALNTVQSEGIDILNAIPMRWRNGVVGNAIFGPSLQAFGHSGWGGSFGCADPENHIAVGYVVNQMGVRSTGEGDPRSLSLSRALYACLRGAATI